MNIIDIVLAVPLVWAIYKGFKKGLVFELTSIAALALGVYGGLHFSEFTAEWLSESFKIKEENMPLISFVVTFIGIVIVVHLIGKLVGKFIDFAALSFVNRVFGSAFSVLKVGLIMSIILVQINGLTGNLNIVNNDTKESSLLYEPVHDFSLFVIPAIKNSKFYKDLDSKGLIPFQKSSD